MLGTQKLLVCTVAPVWDEYALDVLFCHVIKQTAL